MRLFLEFLFKNNHTDMQILKNIKVQPNFIPFLSISHRMPGMG
jgi:hypothetical protein